MTEKIQFKLNGKPMEVTTDSDRMLLWVLRTDLGMTGTKFGCGESFCGACTVLIDNLAVRSCSTPLKYVHDKEVTTIEGLAMGGKLHPLQKAFVDHDGLQCGYCTPGMITRAYRLLQEVPNPTEEQVRFGLAGNLCRCTGYQNIVKAVLAAASEMTAKEAAE